jgi:hypothetical protein
MMRPFCTGGTIMVTTTHLRALTVAAAAVLGLLAIGAQAEPSNKWRIKLNHTVDNDATIVFRVSPIDGTPVDVETKIPAGTGENKAAKMLRDSFEATLGEGYHVETDDGEHVLVKKRRKTPDFDLTLVSSDATGLTIKLKRE